MSKHRDAIKRIHQIDPVDGDRIIADWSATDAKQALFEEITAMPTTTAIPPRHTHPNHQPTRPTVPQRGRRLQLALAAAAIMLAIGVGVTLSTLSEPAYAISQRDDGLIEVNVLPDFRDGDALARDLRQLGIDTVVAIVPASPSMIGQVELFAVEGGLASGIELGADGTTGAFDWTIDPAVFEGTLQVTVYVEADDGEPFGAAQEIFEPGEKLAGLQCALGEPMRAAEVDQYLVQVGITPIWSVVTQTEDPSITNSTIADSVPAGTIITGHAVDNDTVAFDVLLDGDTLAIPSAGGISDTPCTPEAANAWD